VIGDARAPRTPRIATQQIGRDAGFIEEHKPAGIMEGLPLPPQPARGRDISAPLFAGVYGFF
jgi:hypothetical protein